MDFIGSTFNWFQWAFFQELEGPCGTVRRPGVPVVFGGQEVIAELLPDSDESLGGYEVGDGIARASSNEYSCSRGHVQIATGTGVARPHPSFSFEPDTL
jgi:hypothetical protein